MNSFMNTKKISLQGLDKTWDKLKELIIIIIVLYLKNILFEDPDFLGVWCDADIGGCTTTYISVTSNS